MRPSASLQHMKHHGISSSFGLSKFLRSFVFRAIVLHTNILAGRECLQKVAPLVLQKKGTSLSF